MRLPKSVVITVENSENISNMIRIYTASDEQVTLHDLSMNFLLPQLTKISGKLIILTQELR